MEVRNQLQFCSLLWVANHHPVSAKWRSVFNWRFRQPVRQSGLAKQLLDQSHQLLRGIRIPGSAGDLSKPAGKFHSICHLSAPLTRQLAAYGFYGHVALMQINSASVFPVGLPWQHGLCGEAFCLRQASS